MYRIFAAIAALSVATVTPVASAGEGRVDQAEKLEVEPGATEIELQNIYVPASEGDESAWKLAPTFEYGLSDRLGIGLELEFEKEGKGTLLFTELGFQAKWVAIDPEDAPLGLGIQTSLVLDRQGELGSETYLIAEAFAGETDLTANLVYATAPGHWSEDGFSYVLRADQPLGKRLLLGAEAGGELSGEAKGRHWIGPVFTLLPDSKGEDREGGMLPALEFGVFAPLSAVTPDVQFRLELDWEF